MAHRARDGDRQLAARVDVAEQHLGDGLARLLAQVPALEDRPHFFDEMANRQRPAVEQQRDDRLRRSRPRRVDQFVLQADELELRPVAQVVAHPGFARCLLVPADGQHDSSAWRRNFDGLGDHRRSSSGSLGHHFVLLPGAADGDFAPFVVEHLDRVARVIADALENRRDVHGLPL